jgi:hypothetical protein
MTRDQSICQRFDAGETLEAIGQDFGLTRERVRQIVSKSGRIPRRVSTREKHKRFVERVTALNDKGLTVKQIVAETGAQYAVVCAAVREGGGQSNRMSLEERIEMLRLAAKVANGVSVRSACNGDRARSAKLHRFCAAEGITNRRAKRSDYSARADLILALRRDGKTWAEVTASVSDAEGRSLCVGAVMAWASRNVGLPAREQKEPRQKPVRLSQRVDVTANFDGVEVSGLSVREAALALKGRGSARQIAAHLGVSRNSVIGHWFRGRRGNRRSLSEKAAGASA